MTNKNWPNDQVSFYESTNSLKFQHEKYSFHNLYRSQSQINVSVDNFVKGYNTTFITNSEFASQSDAIVQQIHYKIINEISKQLFDYLNQMTHEKVSCFYSILYHP